MQHLRKRMFLLGILYSFSIVIYAGEAGSLITPAQTSSLGASITGLYLQPNANNLDYAVYTVPLPLPSPNWYQQTVKPDYDAAFALGLHYNFSGLSNQARLDWMHFNHTDSASFSVTQPNTSVGPPYYFGPDEQFLLNTTANSRVKFKLDNVNLVVGHFMTLINSLHLEPLLGVGAAYLNEDITNNYAGTDPVEGPYSHRVHTDSKLTGFGPRIGLNGRYFVNSHFGVNAGIASSLLVGRLASSTNFSSWTAFDPDNVLTNNTLTNTTLSNKRQTVVVPEIDGKIELFYTTAFNENSIVSVQVGYMFQDYINSIHQVLPSSLVPGTWEAGTVAIISQNQSRSDLSMNGPYIKLVLS